MGGVGEDAFEAEFSDEEIAGETATFIEWIARRFRKLECRRFSGRHFRRIDHRRTFRLLYASLGLDLFRGRFQRSFHGVSRAFCSLVSAFCRNICKREHGHLARTFRHLAETILWSTPAR